MNRAKGTRRGDVKIHFVMRATNADKREMAEGEGAVKIMELLARRIMLESRLEAEMWQYAYHHAAWVKNLRTRVKDAAPDGDGIRGVGGYVFETEPGT